MESSAFLTLMDLNQDGCMIFKAVRSEAGRIIDFEWAYANASAAQAIGKPTDWFRGRRLLQEMPESKRQGHFDKYAQIVEQRVVQSWEFQFRLQGEDRYFRIMCIPIEDGFGATFIDITESKIAESELVRSRAHLKMIAEELPVYIVNFDANLRYVYVNKAYAGRFNLNPEDLISRRLPDVLGEQTYRQVASYIDRVLSGESVTYETEIDYPTIGKRFMRSANVPELDSRGSVVGLIGVLIDFTEHRRNQLMLEENERRKEELLAVVTHELRNPLAAIQYEIDRLRYRGVIDGQDGSGGLERLQRQLTVMSRLVSDLTDSERFKHGHLRVVRSPTSIMSILDESLATCAPQLRRHHQQVSMEMPDRDLMVDGDGVRLSQVVTNLLMNASKFSPEGSTIRLLVEAQADQIKIRVIDSGMGIEAERMDAIFRLYCQDSMTPSPSPEGFGIGLYLARMIAEAHGGSISVSSLGVGEGAEFSVVLPCPESSSDEPLPRPNLVPLADDQPRLTICIVDDDEDSASALRMLLEALGHSVHCCHSGKEALELLERFRCHLVLLDLSLPDISGFEVAKRLERLQSGHRPTVVALSGFDRTTAEQMDEYRGFSSMLTKPVALADLELLLARQDASSQTAPAA